MNTWKKNLDETKQRYINWWNHKGIVVNMWEHFQEGVTPHADISAPMPPRDLNQRWFDPEWRASYLDWYVSHSSLKADILPVANTQLGPGSLAACLGGRLEGGEDTIWIHPDPDFNDKIVFDPEHPNYLLHKQLLRACKEKAQGRYYVGMPDLMEGLDVLAALKGTDKVLLDTMLQPEVLEEQLQQVNDIYFKVFDELYDIIREGDEMAFCYFSSWAPKKMAKIQCDISTMLSEEDFCRFAQPFLRQQCQKIDYTLYHLDGVGAMRHVPALLDIKELNAIQWTPGVGEPQGGAAKWYPLYRQILEGGKSIMACWVTLEELRPLLDNIGGEGVHLEMEFHNEAEVEEAMRIVEEYQTSAPAPAPKESPIRISTPSVPRINKAASPLEEQAQRRILVLDGAMGTMIQQYNLSEEDFRGERFKNHTQTLHGLSDLLVLSRPEIVEEIHTKYLQAGADLIETNTFSAQRITMGDYGLGSCCRDINLAACRIARQAADKFTAQTPDKPRFVVGSVGPTTKSCSLCSDVDHVEKRALSFSELHQAYKEQMEALIEGGVDALLIETVVDTLNAKAAVVAAQDAMQSQGRIVPIMVSLTLADTTGHSLSGQDIDAFLASMAHAPLFSIGLNCSFGAEQMKPFLRQMAAKAPCYISAYPNAGLPREGVYDQSPEEMQQQVWPLIEEHLINIIGGCCGTTDEHIARYEALVHPAPGIYVSPHRPAHPASHVSLSGLQTLNWDAAEGCLACGSRCDAESHAPFAALVREGRWEEAVRVAHRQVENGARIISISLDDAEQVADVASIERFLRMLTADPVIANIPFIVYASTPQVREAAAQCLQGRSIIGALSLTSEEAFVEEARRLRQLGALVIVRPDVSENALTADERIAYCLRACLLLTLEVGYSPCEVVLDPLTPSLAQRESAAPYLEALRHLRQSWQGCHLVYDAARLVKGLNVAPSIASRLQGEFLQHAVDAGADMILTPSPETLKLKELIAVAAQGHKDALDRLEALGHIGEEMVATKQDASEENAIEIGTGIFDAIVGGNADDAVTHTRQALERGVAPQDIVSHHMIAAMAEVGNLFEVGKAFVPQLLMAGRAMKAALELLRPHLAAGDATSAGKVVIGTVKGDLHDIGKNLVASMLEGSGFEVINVGIDVDADAFIAAIKEHKPHLLCLSALLTTTMTYMQEIIEALKEAGLRDSVKIMVGGAPVSEEFARQIGADGYSDNANAATALARRLMESFK